MEQRTRVLFGIYIRKVLPWLFAAVLLLLLFLLTFPFFFDLILDGEGGILAVMKKFKRYSFIIELGVVYFLTYFLHYSAIGEGEHIFLGILPVERKKQYLCMAGSIFLVILCLMLAENVIVYILWSSKTVYLGGVCSTVCRLVLLLFLTCFFLWLFNVLLIENWWNSILILAALLIFLFCLIRINISFTYLFGSEHNILFYQLKNIWYCLMDLYTKKRNPVQLQVYSTETQELYAQRDMMAMLFCLIFLLLALLFFLLGRQGFCKYGHLGKMKKWNSQRAMLLMLCATVWGSVYVGALGSMEMSSYKMTQKISLNRYVEYLEEADEEEPEEHDWSNIWFIQQVTRNDEPYSDDELFGGDASRWDDDGGEWRIETTALTGKDRKSIEGTLVISAWDRGLVYCIPSTEGAQWAKVQAFLSLVFGAGLGLLFGIWQKRKISSRRTE